MRSHLNVTEPAGNAGEMLDALRHSEAPAYASDGSQLSGRSPSYIAARRPQRGVYLFVLPWAPGEPGGVQEVVLSLALELEKQGTYTPMIAVASWTPLPVPKSVNGVPVVNIPLHDAYGTGFAATVKSLLHLPFDLARILRFLKKNNVRVVNPHFPGIGAAAFLLLRWLHLYDGKVILSFHGADVTELRQSQGYSAAVFKKCLPAADGLVVCSNSLARSLSQIAPCAPIRVVYNGADWDMFNAGKSPQARSKQILHVGRFEHKKAQDVLLNAFGQLLDRGLDVTLTMVGATGPALEQTRRLAARFGDRARIVVGVPHQQIPEYYTRSDLFVLPSRHEPFGIVLVEAAASGLPVVATRVGGITELIQHESTGVLVEPDDSVMLAAAMERVLMDEPLALKLATAWHRDAARFTWANTARGYFDVLAGQPAPPGSRPFAATEMHLINRYR